MDYYCYDSKKDLFNEYRYANLLGKGLFYDKETDNFYNQNNEIICIKDLTIFPRTSIFQSKKLIDVITNHGGISIITYNDYNKTLNWPCYIKTTRNNIILTGNEIINNPQIIINTFKGNNIFFKTKEKNFSQIISINSLLDNNSIIYKTILNHQFEEFLLFDVVDIKKDKFGHLEYRAFIIDSEIFNISRISDYLMGTIPEEVLSKLTSLVNELKITDFPRSYVIDLFIYKNNLGNDVIDVLECNPIITSGTYLYNSIFEKQTDLLHRCPSASIPREKIKYGQVSRYRYDVVSNIHPSICYNYQGGFAADFLSYFANDVKSSQETCFHFSDELDCSNFASFLEQRKILFKQEMCISNKEFNNYQDIKTKKLTK